MKRLLLSFYLFSSHLILLGQNPELEENWWKPIFPYNSTSVFVDEIHESVYLSGSFTRIGRYANYGIPIDIETGVPDFSFDLPDGQVYGVASDGIGGWYIRGYFDQVGDSIRNGLAHIGGDGKVTAWNPDFNNSIQSMQSNNGVLYLGGSFTAIDGLERNGLASFDAASGAITDWSPNVGGFIYAFGFSENRMYIGGSISSVNDEPRSIACFDMNTGELEGWNPGGINGEILDIEVENEMVYVAGTFSSVSGIERNRLASFDAITGAISSWTPSVTNDVGWTSRVNELEIKGDTIFVGGIFGFIEGQNRENLAAISINSNEVFEWVANVNDKVVAMAINGNTLFIGGEFSFVSDESRRHLASIDTNSGELLEWNPDPYGGDVFDFEISNNEMYVGGSYSVIGLLPRLKFAALDFNTGAPKDWSPSLGGNSAQVEAFAASAEKIYMAGPFNAIDGQPRNGVAEFDAATGELLDWNPSFDGVINDLLVHEGQLYVAGEFITVDGVSRNRLASFDLNTGELSDWNPVVNGAVLDLDNSGDSLFVAGNFTSVGGQTRLRVAVISTITGIPYDWIVNADDEVSAIMIDNSYLYVGGTFYEINGLERQGIAAINKNTAEVTPWSTESGPGNVIELAAAGNSIFVIGYFSGINGESHNRFVELDKITAAPSDWNPILTGYPAYLVTSQNKLFLSGSIQTEEGGDEFCVYSPICNYPTLPTFVNDELTVCTGGSVSLNIGNGQLNDGINWKWYTGSCGGVEIETGNQIEVTPAETTTYYVRGEGGCTVVSECASITVNVVEDIAPPTITAPADMVINADEGTCTASEVSLGIVISDDNCGIESVVDDAPNSFELGTTTVTWLATDISGNTATATQTITVLDTESPTINDCPGDILITSNEPNCAATVVWNEPAGIDNCTANPAMTSNWESGSIYSFGNTEVIYTVTDESGNANTCAFNIEVVSDIIADTLYSGVSCFGDMDGYIELNLSGGQGDYLITWNGPNGFGSSEASVDELMPGIYTAVIDIDGGCTTTVQVEVSEPDELSITYTAYTVTSTADGYITCNALGGTAPYIFSWTGPNGFASDQRDIYSLIEGGSYFVTVIDANGCEYVQEIVLDSTVGIGDVYLDGFSVYPNPNNGQLHIDSPSEFIGEEVYITNILGEKIYSKIITQLTTNVNMEQYPSGLYLIHVARINQPIKVIKL